jgi:hypothetical protein
MQAILLVTGLFITAIGACFVLLTSSDSSESSKITTGGSGVGHDCALFNKEHFKSAADRPAVERLIVEIIINEHRINSYVDWGKLSQCFTSLGNDFTFEELLGGGSDGADVYRFTVDNTDRLFWMMLMPVPGGSNGKFTVIVSVKDKDQIAIIERGGRPRWLQLE